MVLVDILEAQEIIANNLFSEDTKAYLNRTTMKTADEQQAFIQGMAYAALLIGGKCPTYKIVEE